MLHVPGGELGAWKSLATSQQWIPIQASPRNGRGRGGHHVGGRGSSFPCTQATFWETESGAGTLLGTAASKSARSKPSSRDRLEAEVNRLSRPAGLHGPKGDCLSLTVHGAGRWLFLWMTSWDFQSKLRPQSLQKWRRWPAWLLRWMTSCDFQLKLRLHSSHA